MNATPQLLREVNDRLRSLDRLIADDQHGHHVPFLNTSDAASIVLGLGQAAPGVADAVLAAVWPAGVAAPLEWWPTPLGRLCARSYTEDPARLSYTAAATMLEITGGSVSQMLRRGNLARHPDGGVLRGAVMARLATPRP